MTIAWPRSLRLGSLRRAARDTDSNGRAPFAHAPSFTARIRPWNGTPQVADWLPPGDDAHPDAPPRMPIMASRDLPDCDVEETARQEPGPRPVVISRPVRDLIDEARPRPLPRSPQPLSESQLDEIRRILAGEDDAAATPAPATALAEQEADDDADILDLSLVGTVVTDDMPLSWLVERFERQVDRRIAIGDSIDAAARAGTCMDLGVADDAPPRDIDTALRSALDRLKALSEPRRQA